MCDRRRVVGRGAACCAPTNNRRSANRRPAGTTGAGVQTGRSAARLLLARDVRAPGDERSQLRDLVAGRHRADLLDAGHALAAAHWIRHRRAAHVGAGLRLPTRLVPRWPDGRIRPLRARRNRAAAARSGIGPRHAAHRQPRRESRSPVVAGWVADCIRFVDLQWPLAHLRPEPRRGEGSAAAHRRQRQQAAALLLQQVGSLHLADVVA